MERRKTKSVKVGKFLISGDAPVTVQSMLNTKNGDAEAAVAQSQALKKVGCDIIRLAVTDEKSLEVVKELKKAIDLPLVADIQFDFRMALGAIAAGIDKIRLNPGNIGSADKVKSVVAAAAERKIPIRVGVNSGSVSKEIAAKYGRYSAEGLVLEAMRHIQILEDCNFEDIVISLKASNVATMIESYRLMASKCSYPLHLGVTEAGTSYSGTIKSAVGIGTLLAEGIGDTIRVSLTDQPEEEIRAGIEILKSLGLKKSGATLVSCPTCSRCSVNLIQIAKEVEERLANMPFPIKVAVMGCVVNGPGEAQDADIGITGANGEGLIFKKGKIIKKVPEDRIVDELFVEIEKLFKER
ncbi:flavodoxin-dependent (E)-4-hydroxy-3-methylbut-2-enyl-diphosphate synthase [Congzhengia minquanensis]|uniref:4-hydroxy-3-methylbut-2-en-1-yl diphosphate synthase (flavodoxin) n=1 Tax=Congzhengia minquanensis TaxID=2763657 RepID=A0A926DLD1_9FIRM|nr:flavodoxin-dependent (E)-4-hydroxy-3-methylbut-2-enyl-diphosphate synthase [Congzhengia minquanensis]